MSAGRSKAFTKTLACPSSDDIFSRRLPLGKSDWIARHVARCDFCAAEQSLLSAYSQTSQEYEPVEMPAHLCRLAEVMLMGKLKDFQKRSGHGKEPPVTRTGVPV